MKFKHLCILLLILSLISLSVGAQTFSWELFIQHNVKMQQVFWLSRVPRLLSVILAGSSMSIAGLLMQTMTQNEFAAPSTIGTTEAAKLGLLLSLFFFNGPSLFQKMLCAFICSFAFTIVFIMIQQSLQLKEKWMIPLVGLIFSGMISAFTNMISYQFHLVQSLTSWTQGSFSMIQTNQYEWLFFGLIIIIVSTKLAHVYTIANLGESISLNLGISYKQLEWLTLLLVSLTTSVTMITVGSLPFIGIIIPNLVRYLSGDDLKKTIPQTALLGAVLVLACDIIARLVIPPYEVSVSLILGIVGAGLLMSQILRISSQRRGSIR